MNWFETLVLSGRHIRLEPLDPDQHAAPMFAHFEARVTDFLSQRGAPITTPEEMGRGGRITATSQRMGCFPRGPKSRGAARTPLAANEPISGRNGKAIATPTARLTRLPSGSRIDCRPPPQAEITGLIALPRLAPSTMASAASGPITRTSRARILRLVRASRPSGRPSRPGGRAGARRCGGRGSALRWP